MDYLYSFNIKEEFQNLIYRGKILLKLIEKLYSLKELRENLVVVGGFATNHFINTEFRRFTKDLDTVTNSMSTFKKIAKMFINLSSNIVSDFEEGEIQIYLIYPQLYFSVHYSQNLNYEKIVSDYLNTFLERFENIPHKPYVTLLSKESLLYQILRELTKIWKITEISKYVYDAYRLYISSNCDEKIIRDNITFQHYIIGLFFPYILDKQWERLSFITFYSAKREELINFVEQHFIREFEKMTDNIELANLKNSAPLIASLCLYIFENFSPDDILSMNLEENPKLAIKIMGDCLKNRQQTLYIQEKLESFLSQI